jgi:quercetin dioxygenase-like cupin family protein
MSDPSDDRSDMSGLIEQLAGALEPSEIPNARRLRMRKRIGELVPAQLPAGMTTLRAAQTEWRRVAPLVEVKVLRADVALGNQTVLIRVAPGGVMPRHRHSQDEEFIVLEGECRIGTLRLAAGDAHFADAGSWHDDITTETGVLVLLRGEYPAPVPA